ncbi:MAG: hypothetical protein QXN36_00890 [Candidatus Bathyarchaeia archaeon]
MEIPNFKTWKTVVLLSIIVVPVGLFVTFKLTERTSEPQTIAETATLEPVRWEFERPAYTAGVTENLEWENLTAAFCGSDYLMSSRVTIYTCVGDWDGAWDSPFGGQVLWISVSANISLPSGYITYGNVSFLEDREKSSKISFYSFQRSLNDYDNMTFTFSWLSPVSYAHGLRGKQKAYFNMIGLNAPREASFWRIFYWILYSPYNQTHTLKIDIQFTYFNGTVYKRVIQPFVLKVFPDDNNSFETAEELSVNQTRRAYIEYYSLGNDIVDYYKVWLQKGTTANFQLNYLDKAGIEMYVYSPKKQIEACLVCRVNETLSQLTLNIEETGWWYIKIDAGSAEFIYTVTVTTQSDEA